MGRAREEEKKPKMTKRENQEGVAGMVELYENEKLGKGKPMSWRGLG